ncbi:MAG: Fe-S protein assembly co-chaperone HscB [Burkholderiaceae bacterium]
MQNHFELFGIPSSFAVDAAVLERAYHDVQTQVHPDKFSLASDAEKRVAMQWAARANEAYEVLKNPLRRARYLCELHGIDLEIESNTSMPGGFLMQQMAWREELDEARSARDVGALEALDTTLRATRRDTVARIAVLLDSGDFADAAQDVRKLMFIEKFSGEIDSMFDELA